MAAFPILTAFTSIRYIDQSSFLLIRFIEKLLQKAGRLSTFCSNNYAVFLTGEPLCTSEEH
jgi:hypothetical protein